MTTDLREHLRAALGGSYLFERELGGGGMARVFVAEERALGRRVVVKVLPPELTEDMSLERFEREVRLAARLQHPNIVPLLTAGDRDGLAYYVMPYVEGESLRARIEREGRLRPAAAVSVLRDVARALEYAHAQGVVHRDVKPDNVLLSGSAAAVADFGIAKALDASRTGGRLRDADAPDRAKTLTHAGTTLGTPAYMAPEQAAGDPNVDARADIYAWGVVAYELLAGSLPFARSAAHQLVAAHIGEPPPPLPSRAPDAPPALAALVMRCLEKDPARRPQSAGELLDALEAVARTPSGGQAAGSRRRRVRRAAAGALAALGLAAIATAVAYYRTRAPAAPETPVLAVLPFENQGPPADAYFADGLTDEVTTRLAALPGLRVIGRMSASQYKGTTKSPQAIARELGATHLLTGTVRWERTPGGGRVRVSPELMRAADQASVWNEPYEGPLDDVFRMQANVAERVAAALDVALRGVTTPPTQSLDAYDAYLRGLANATQRYSPPALAAAVRAFERAVALDPNFAAAHARLALAFIDSRLLSADTAFIAKARASAERAVALDSTLADALFARAAVLRAEGDFDRAYRAVLAAARAAPSDPRVLYLLGELEEIQGHPDRAIATALRAMVLEPRSPYPPGYLASLYDRVHRHEEAIQVRERVFALSSEDPLGLGYLTQAGSYLLWRADTAGARRVLERGGPAVIRLLVRLPDGPAGRGIWRAVLPAAVLRADDTLSFDAFSGGRAVGMATVFQRPEMFYVMKLRHFVMMGRPDRARPYADSIVALLEPRRWEPDVRMLVGLFSRRAILAEAYAHLGRNADAAEETDRYLAEARQAREGGEEGGYTRALVNAAYIDVVAGRHDLAVARLEEALRGPSGAAISRALLRADPSWAPLRGHPGFARLLAGGS